MGLRLQASALPGASLAALGLLFLCAPPASASSDVVVRPGALVVGVEGGDARPSEVGGRRLAPGIRVLRGGSRNRLASRPGVRYAEPNHLYRASRMPTDRLFARQWPLSHPDGIGAASVWWASTGAPATVAVLDSGIAFGHPDLAPNLWRNPREVPGNGLDDDRNGFVDDAHGADVIDAHGEPIDGHGHGTAMSGVIAARGGNGIGISGVAPRARIMPVRILDDRGVGTTATLVAGIRYATLHGADVINLSVNGREPSTAVDEALRMAEAAGVVVVAAAGNDGANRDRVPSYPASSAAPGVIAVAASARDHGLAYFSGWGRLSVDLAAPGEDILTTAHRGGYRRESGSSAATAHVSGAAALLAAAKPSATPVQLRAALLRGAVPLRRDRRMVATGELDVARSLRRLVPGAGPRVRLVMRRVKRSRSPRLTLRWRLSGARRAVAGFRLRLANRHGVRRFAITSGPGKRLTRRRTLRVRPGRYRWTVEALDAGGRPLARRTARVHVSPRRR